MESKLQKETKITHEEERPQIGTEILDPSLPSDIKFDSSKGKQLEEFQGKSIPKNIGEFLQIDQSVTASIKNYTIKGKYKVEEEPKYKVGTFVKGEHPGFVVKAYDEQRSGGLKGIWQSIVGYVKRQILIRKEYIYIFQRTGDFCEVKDAYKVSELFKIFVDTEQSKIRLVFRPQNGGNKLVNKNIKHENYEQIMGVIKEEIGKTSLGFIQK